VTSSCRLLPTKGERALETLVGLTFAEQDGKTRMTFRQALFQSIQERDGHQEGWTSTFDRLDQHLAYLMGATNDSRSRS